MNHPAETIPALPEIWPRISAVAAHAAIVDATNRFFTAETESWSPEPVSRYVRFNLTHHLLQMGDYEWAARELERLESWTQPSETRDRWGRYALSFSEALGPRHPISLRARMKVAFWRGNSGDAGGAAVDLGDVLGDIFQVFGAHDSALWEVGVYLARFLNRAQRFGEGLGVVEWLVPGAESCLGQRHPVAFEARKERASLYGVTGQVAQARAMYEEDVELLKGMGDPYRPEILHTRINLASWRRKDGDFDGAVDEANEVLPHAERAWGVDDPRVLSAREILACCAGEQGDPAAATRGYQALAIVRGRIYGPAHPETLAAIIGYAHWAGVAGDREFAVVTLSALIPNLVEVLGVDHHNTRFARRSLDALGADTG